MDDILMRLRRIYAAIGETIDEDLSKFRPKPFCDGNFIGMHIDFMGGLNKEQIINIAQAAISNVANLSDHIKRWARNNNKNINLVNSTVISNEPVQIIMDLANNDKHGYPPRDGGKSKRSPQLKDINRVMKLSPGSGSPVGVLIPLNGSSPTVTKGKDGFAGVVITGQIVDNEGKFIGNLDDILSKAVKVWEDLIDKLKI